MELLPMVQVVPEMNLAIDPSSGIIGASLGSGVIVLSMDSVNEEVNKLCAAADELEQALNPYDAPVGSYPGRDGVHVTAGLLTNVVYGFVIASLFIFAALPFLIRLGVI